MEKISFNINLHTVKNVFVAVNYYARTPHIYYIDSKLSHEVLFSRPCD